MSLSRMSHSLINISSSTDSQRLRSFDTASSIAATPPSSPSAATATTADLMDRVWDKRRNKYDENESEGVIRSLIGRNKKQVKEGRGKVVQWSRYVKCSVVMIKVQCNW